MRRQALIATAVLLAACPGLVPSRVQAATERTQPKTAEISKAAELQGDAARAQDDFLAAEGYYQKAVRNNRNSPDLYNKLGVVQLKNGNQRGAHASFSRAVKLDPQNVRALNNMGAFYCVEKKYKQAIDTLKRALALDESIAAAHMNMAEAWMGRGDADRAMTE